MYRQLIGLPRRFRKSTVILAVILTFFACSAESCSSGSSKGQKTDSAIQKTNYDQLVAQDPAHTMSVSPTRKTINRWIDTWGKDPNKLAYVYLQNSNGQLIGYYVFKGLPVSYCTALTPTYRFQDPGGSGDRSNAMVPAPSIDGVFYSGGECNTYYGFDATSGAYVEYTAGLGINVLIYDKPLTNHPNVENLAPGGGK